MPDQKPISAAEARKRIAENVKPLGEISLAIPRALGYALAEEIVAGENIPQFDNSAMDGYAVRAGDTSAAPKILAVIGEVAAGGVAASPVAPGSAMAIMTGAKIPDGADAVIQHELTELTADGRLRVMAEITAGTNIRRAGADILKGSVVLRKGDTLRPPELGILASLGKGFVRVTRAPEVAVLPTGNEIVDIDKTLSEGKIRNSNSYSLAGLVAEAGAHPVRLEIAKDTAEDLRAKILQGLQSDMLITIGGVSAGKYDLVLKTWEELGIKLIFWKVNIRPGMPLAFGMKDGKPVFGLPGNAVSSVVTFMQFVKQAIEKLMGKTERPRLTIRVKLAHGMKKTDGRRHFVRGILENIDGALTVRSTGPQVSNLLTSLSLANCLIILPETSESIAEGEEVDVELL
jgi:molybdopterin molybdotransferase